MPAVLPKQSDAHSSCLLAYLALIPIEKIGRAFLFATSAIRSHSWEVPANERTAALG